MDGEAYAHEVVNCGHEECPLWEAVLCKYCPYYKENVMKKLIDGNKVKEYIKRQINPYGKPTAKTAYEFGLEIMEYIDNMFPYSEEDGKD